MGFSRQEYWSGLPFPSPGDLPDPGIEPWSPTLEAGALTSEPPGKPHSNILAWKIPWAEEPVGYSPWGDQELDMTVHTHTHFFFQLYQFPYMHFQVLLF